MARSVLATMATLDGLAGQVRGVDAAALLQRWREGGIDHVEDMKNVLKGSVGRDQELGVRPLTVSKWRGLLSDGKQQSLALRCCA